MKTFIATITLLIIWINIGFCQILPESKEAYDMKKAGLINIQSLDATIVVELKYASSDNFLKTNVYGTLREAYLQPDAAEKLVKAQKILKSEHPNLSIIVYDAVRPRSVQQKMWDIVRNTPDRKYVSSPGRISMHSYGVAADVSIIDENGIPIDMGAGFDEFSEISEPRHEKRFLQEKKLTQQHIDNRNILRNAMTKAGYTYIQNEWWHFQSESRDSAARKYNPVD
jgi:D-alanyl-D-alanine dipeptidase